MKVSGFTFIRNAIKYDYPIIEAVKSILPLCDELIIAVGKSDDNTPELLNSLNNDKIQIIPTVWNEELRTGGRVLADETNKAIAEISTDSDWAFYIQGDEVLHEKYLDSVYNAMTKYKNDSRVEGLLFDYKHFYGSYDYVGESFRWYRKEIRVIRNDKSIYSHLDAQGFRKGNNEKLKVKHSNACIYHYGWVKHPKFQQAKQEDFNKLWHDEEWIKQNVKISDEFDYSDIDSLELFDGSHPKVMIDRINRINWKFTHDISRKNYSQKEKIKRAVEKFTGLRLGEYKNYILLKD
ncbi:MAG: glycosyltransferase family 2 protein [Candidatus Kapabacteria bacterium]|jgi:hypothetical protein|nr:glycosyltransferase family 2 protein [Candidatus Kapabacteria bacterium]